MTITEAPETLQDQQRPATGRWCAGTRLLVWATAAWTVLLVLHVLLAGRWWPWFVVEVTPPLTVVVVPLLLLALVPFARPVRCWLGPVLVVLLLAGAHLAGFGPRWTGGPNSPAGTEVAVFAWSTDYWQLTDDKDAFYAYLRSQDADVYLLQEYLYWNSDDEQGCSGPQRIDDSARLRAEFPGYQLVVHGELLTLSRLPVVAAPNRQVPGTGTDWYWHGTKAQRTDLLVGGRTVSFYNVHLPVPFRTCGSPLSGGFYRSFKDQETWRDGELDNLRTELADNPNPAVVAGDFNSPWMELSLRGTGTRPHRPAGSVLPAHSWPVTGCSCTLPGPLRALPRLWRLDWLFTTGGLAVPSYHLRDGRAFSDHLAQEIRVVVPD